MDQHKQGQQGPGHQHTQQGQQGQGDKQNWNSQAGSPNRDKAEGDRQQHAPGSEQTRGTGQSGGGITNRSMEEEMSEQEELPERGTSRQSER